MRKPRNITALLFCLLTSLTSFADNSSEQTLYQLMSERLALMPEVAKYKWHHNLPIEDLAREAIVLERTVSRTTVLDPIHTRTFFGLQITAAKAIQANVFQSLTNRDVVASDVRSLNEELRPKLTLLGDQIIEQLLIAYQEGTPLNRANFDTHFAHFELNPQIKDGLFKSLELVLTQPNLDPRDTLARLEKDKTLRVGVTLDYEPFSYQDNEGNRIGIDIELATALAKEFGYRIVWVKTSWPTLMADAEDNLFDIALSGISITAQRQHRMMFSVPYHTGGKTAIGRCSSVDELSTLALIDRAEIRIIVNPGGTNERFVRSALANAHVRIHPDNRTIFNELVSGTADVMFTDSIEAHLQTTKHPSLCVLLDQPLTFQQKGILLQPDRELKERIDTWLLHYLSSHDISALFTKHGVDPD